MGLVAGCSLQTQPRAGAVMEKFAAGRVRVPRSNSGPGTAAGGTGSSAAALPQRALELLAQALESARAATGLAVAYALTVLRLRDFDLRIVGG